jgi:hypothetical protein
VSKAFVKSPGAAVPVGFLWFTIAWIMIVIVAFGMPYNSHTHKGAARPLYILFSMTPWCLLAKGIEVGRALISLASVADQRGRESENNDINISFISSSRMGTGPSGCL